MSVCSRETVYNMSLSAGGQPQGPAPLAVAAVNQLMGGMAAIPQAQAPGHEPQTNTTVSTQARCNHRPTAAT